MKLTVLMSVAALGLLGCKTVAVSQTVETVDVAALAGLMENVFNTAPDNKDTIIRDKRVRVNSPNLEGVWFYSQLNTGETGKLYRQRISNLELSDDGTAVVQIAYGLKEAARYENAWETPDLLSNLALDDIDPYFTKGCEQTWTPAEDRAWTGYVDPKTCVVTSKRRNKDIRIESEGYLSKDVYRTNERGYEMDMSFLWGTKPGEFITLYPAP